MDKVLRAQMLSSVRLPQKLDGKVLLSLATIKAGQPDHEGK